MNAPGTIVVFAKPPEPGTAKTRLIPAVGPEGSAAIARALFTDTWTTLSELDARLIVGSTSRRKLPLGLTQSDPLWLQGEGDLGQRMERILARCCDEGPWGIITGADSPGLTADVVRDAMVALEHTDAVLVLLALGADPTVADTEGWTPCMACVEIDNPANPFSGSVPCLRALAAGGPGGVLVGDAVNAVNTSTGNTALDTALNYDRHECAAVLRDELGGKRAAEL